MKRKRKKGKKRVNGWDHFFVQVVVIDLMEHRGHVLAVWSEFKSWASLQYLLNTLPHPGSFKNSYFPSVSYFFFERVKSKRQNSLVFHDATIRHH